MLLMLQIGHGRFQPGPEMSLGFQTQRQSARLGVSAGRAGDFVLLGFDHHRLNDGQFSDLPADGALGLQRLFAVLPADGAGAGVRFDHPSRAVRQWALGLGMSGFRPAVPPAFWLGPIRLLVARGRLRRVMRVGRRPLELPNFGFQSFQALGQLDDQSHQFVARLCRAGCPG